MLNQNILIGLRSLTVGLVVLAAMTSLGAGSCGGGAADSSTANAVSLPGGSISGSITGTSGASGVSASSGSTTAVNAVQIITMGGSTGSFDLTSVPISGGASVVATRLYNLDGSLITVGNLPPWFVQARVFLTSTRTSSGTPNPSANGAQDTPCAYFDTVTDANPGGPNGYYTIDGYNTSLTPNDIDQCAGTASSELSQLGLYVQVDRNFLNPTDKIELIVKAEAIDVPNTTPGPGSCVSSGFFDPTACSNTVFTTSMRQSPGASAKPFYLLFPSAKALDLLSEAVLLPINNDQSITTLSVDRVKGGAVFYGLSVVRLQ